MEFEGENDVFDFMARDEVGGDVQDSSGPSYEIFKGPSKDAVIFCVDCGNTARMFGAENLFGTTMNIIYSFMRSKVVASDGSDQTGIILYNVEKGKNILQQAGISVFQSLGPLSAHRIREVKTLGTLSSADFAVQFGGSGQADVSELLFVCTREFKQTSASYRPRMFIFTSDDDPCGTDRRARKAAQTRASDFHEGLWYGADINVIPLGDTFDVTKFWDKIVLFSALGEAEDSSDASAQFLANALIQLDEMREVVLKKVYKKRPLNRVDMYLSPGSSEKIAFMAYTSYYPAPRPKQVDIDARTYAPLLPDTNFVSDMTGEIVSGDTIRTAFEVGPKGSGVMVEVSKDEVVGMKQWDGGRELSASVSGMLELVEFCAQKNILRPEHCLGHGQFLYPQPERVAGSDVLVAALISSMLARDLVAVCRYVAKKNSQMTLVALIPQQEVIDPETQRQERSPGFHLIALPHLEDVRRLDLKGTNVGNQMASVPEFEPRWKTMVDSAASVIQAMSESFWEPDTLDSPALQDIYVKVEAMALELPASEAERVRDLVAADPAKVQLADNGFVQHWLAAMNVETTEECALAGQAVKRKPEVKTESQFLSLEEVRRMAKEDLLNTLTVENLKAVIAGFPTLFHNVSATGRKPELIEKIKRNINNTMIAAPLLEDIETHARAMTDHSKAMQWIDEQIRGNGGIGLTEHNYLRFVQWSLTKERGDEISANGFLEEIIQSFVAQSRLCLDDDNDLLMFSFALHELRRFDAVIEKIIVTNIDRVKLFFPNHFCLTQIDQGQLSKSGPPRPIASAPPKPVLTTNRSTRIERHQALPGYTAGWMAADYAEKHNL